MRSPRIDAGARYAVTSLGAAALVVAAAFVVHVLVEAPAAALLRLATEPETAKTPPKAGRLVAGRDARRVAAEARVAAFAAPLAKVAAPPGRDCLNVDCFAPTKARGPPVAAWRGVRVVAADGAVVLDRASGVLRAGEVSQSNKIVQLHVELWI